MPVNVRRSVPSTLLRQIGLDMPINFIEKVHPKCISLISIGCGADIGPQPTGSAKFAKEHGQEIADEVSRLLKSKQLQRLNHLPTVDTRSIQLPLEPPPERSHWEALAKTRSFDKELALKMLREIEDRGSLRDVCLLPHYHLAIRGPIGHGLPTG